MHHFKTWLRSMVFVSMLAIAMAIAGCRQSPSPVPGATATTAATLTSTPLPTRTLQDTPTPTPILPTSTPMPDLTATAAACKPAAQVTDARSDSAPFRPGETFTQTWRLASSGNCAWEKDTRLAFQSGEKFSAPDSIPIGAVDVGKSVAISLTLKAPGQAGVYTSTWALQRPSGQPVITASVRITVVIPAPAVAAVVPTTPPAAAQTGLIPPVGSGPFGADESASGPWNCVKTILPVKGTSVFSLNWLGEFFIGVHGGPGNYSISDTENCRWDAAQAKFVCRYGAAMGSSLMRTVTVSCPGCKSIQVALSGRGVESRDTGSGICQVQNVIVQLTPPAVRQPPAPPPGQPVAPMYPKSPIQPWNRDAFLKALGASKDAVAAFRAEFVFIAAGKMGDCGIFFWKYYSQWELQPAFSDVPANWYPMYYQYRVSLENVRAATWPISEICLKRGGTIPEETSRHILATTQASIDSLGQLYARAQAIK